MKDCRKKAAGGKPQTAQSPGTPEPKAKGKGKGGQGKKGASSLDEWPDGQEEQPSGEKSGDEVASLSMGAVDRREKRNRREGPYRREKYDRLDWQAWERIQKKAPQQWESCKDGNLGAMGERIDLTIDSDCAACALLVGVASAVGMEELNRAPHEYIAANAEKIRELGFKTPTLKFQNGDVQNLKFSVMNKLHKPLVVACKVVAAGAAGEPWWLVH